MKVAISLLLCIAFGTGILLSPYILQQNVEPKFLEIAKEVAHSHAYDKDKFNCVDFSNALAERLREEGYNAKVVEGWVFNSKYCEIRESDELLNKTEAVLFYQSLANTSCASAHAWVVVEVPIEATTGEPINPKLLGDDDK